jgi:hypothetical protein
MTKPVFFFIDSHDDKSYNIVWFDDGLRAHAKNVEDLESLPADFMLLEFLQLEEYTKVQPHEYFSAASSYRPHGTTYQEEGIFLLRKTRS